MRVGEPVGNWVEIARSGVRDALDERSLVLEAAHIPSGVVRVDGEHVLVVRTEDAPRARAEIEAFLSEGLELRPGAPEPVVPSAGVDAAVAYTILLGGMFLLQRARAFGIDWIASGAADARAIRDGAWWRAITALGLHSDLVHLAGNLLFGGVFLVMLSQSVGAGWAALVFVGAGGAANVLNAWAQAPSHVSIGASTGVFGLLGAQVAFDWSSGRRASQSAIRRFAPLVIGAALLAWIGGGPQPDGTGDWPISRERIDVGAHVLGFAIGSAAGGALGFLRGRPAFGRRVQAILGTLAIGAVLLAWWLAL